MGIQLPISSTGDLGSHQVFAPFSHGAPHGSPIVCYAITQHFQGNSMIKEEVVRLAVLEYDSSNDLPPFGLSSDR